MSRKDSHHHGNLSCSFCGKGQREVRKLIAGPTVYICDECIKLCNDIIADATSLTEAGYVGEDVENIIQNLLHAADYDVEKAARGIVYIDEIDKIARKGDTPSPTRDVGGEGVQQALLKIIEGTRANVTPRGGKKYNQQEYIQVDTSNILFICGGAFYGIENLIKRRTGEKGLGFGANIGAKDNRGVGEMLQLIEPTDLIKFGMIPEFVGRLPMIATLDDLTEDDLVTILTQPKNALVKQYQKLFEMERVKLTFSREALRSIAHEAMRRKAGARGLRAIMENAMLDIQYDVPYRDSIKECKITEGVITRGEEPTLLYEKDRKTA